MDGNTLFVGFILGTIGVAFFIYGRKQQRFVPLFSGIVLCIMPYILSNLAYLVALSVVLIILPFVFKF